MSARLSTNFKKIKRMSLLQIIFYTIISVLILLLFVGGANQNSSSLNKALWDTGHLYLFAALAIAALNSQVFKRKTALQSLIWLFFLSALLGVGIELAQLLVGRYSELSDVVFDLLGTLLGVLFFYIYKSQQRLMSILKATPFLLLIMVVVFHPVWLAYQDQRLMQNDFPVLADFESEYELNRWDEGHAQILRSRNHAVHGQFSLVVNFLPSLYSGFSLIRLEKDWRSYSQFRFSIFNDQNEVIKINLKIVDRVHSKYSDRFNTGFDLQPGRNEIEINLADVHNAPKRRLLDMANIIKIGLFLDDPKQSKLMYLDYFRLVK